MSQGTTDNNYLLIILLAIFALCFTLFMLRKWRLIADKLSKQKALLETTNTNLSTEVKERKLAERK